MSAGAKKPLVCLEKYINNRGSSKNPAGGLHRSAQTYFKCLNVTQHVKRMVDVAINMNDDVYTQCPIRTRRKRKKTHKKNKKKNK